MIAIYATRCDFQNYQQQHDVAYKLLYEVLKTYYGYSESQIIICKTEEGKPYCKDLPIHFSLCHTDGLVLVAVSDMPCGLDAEPNDRIVSSAVARRFLKFDFATAADWTRYESIGKLFGCGIPFAINDYTCHTRFYNEIDGYIICCASLCDNFPKQIILL